MNPVSATPPASAWRNAYLGLLGFLWLLGHLTSTDVIQQICLLAMIIGLVWGVLGTSAVRALLFPLEFLLFVLPMADRLIPAVQDFTARFAVKMLDL